MKHNKILFFFLIFVTRFCYNADIGSDTAVTRFNTQQTLEEGDRIAGFAAIAGGFKLAGFQVGGTFDSFFPVSGNVAFNAGNLTLNQDLIFHNITSILSLGNIIGNCHVIEFAPKITCFPTGEVETGCDISFVTDATQDDQVNDIDWSFDSEYIVIGIDDAGGASDQLIVYSWDGSVLTLEDGVDLGNDVFGVAWHPTNDWIAVGRASGTGDELYTYTFDRSAGTLTLIDSVNLGGSGNNSANKVAWHPGGEHLALARDSSGAGIKVAVYEIDSAGNIVVVGGSPVTDSFNANANDVDWDVDGSYLGVVTDASGSVDELIVYDFTASPLSIVINASFNVAQQSNTISWNLDTGRTDLIAIGVTSGSDRVRVYSHDDGGGGFGAGMLTFLDGNAGTQVNSVHWHPDGQCLIAGLQDNSEGSGGELRTYSFLDDTLTQEDDQEVSENVLAVRWSPDGMWLATGDDGLGGATPDLAIYQFDAALRDLTSFTFSDVELVFNNNITLRDSTITFSGCNIINGRNKMLTLASTSTIQVAANSSVFFQDITIKQVNSHKIRGLDSTSSFTFQNTTFLLDADFTFTQGKFEVIKDFHIKGKDNTFCYSSDQVSRIRGGIIQPSDGCDEGYCGRLIVNEGATFEYNPPGGEPDRVQYEDAISEIVLNSGTLTATTAWELTKGILRVEGRSAMRGSGGITIGDGSSSGNNICYNTRPAANLELFGKLINKNI